LVCDHLYCDGNPGDYLLLDPGAAGSDLADQGRDREIEKDIQMRILKRLISKIRKRFGLYDLRYEGARWVRKNIGEEYVNEFLEKYDNLSRGIPIGGIYETAVFLDMIETIREQI